MDFTRIRSAAVAIILGAMVSDVHGQPNWQFIRQTDQGAVVTAEEFPYANLETSYDFDQAADEILATVATHASVTDLNWPTLVYGEGASLAQAMNLTPTSGITYAPTVDTTVSHSDIAIATVPDEITILIPVALAGSHVEQSRLVQAYSEGSFLLEAEATTGFLHGSMYLVGIVNGSESDLATYFGHGFVRATIGQWFVQALYDDDSELWEVNVSLPEINQTFLTGDVNHYFTFSVPVAAPTTININATSVTFAYADAYADAGLGDGMAQGQVNLSASAWITYTPTENPPPDGDFDGDGDVDGEDFLALQRGFGETMGATLSQGDADHNGIVNGDDLAIWEANYGTQLETLSAVTAVPEPSSLAIALVVELFFLTASRRRRTDPSLCTRRDPLATKMDIPTDRDECDTGP